jgi:hypothetical protein
MGAMGWREIDERLIRRGELILDLDFLEYHMEALEVVQCLKRGRRNFYILKGAYDEERLSEILLEAGSKPPPRPRRSSREPKKEQVRPHTRSVLGWRAQAGGGHGGR